MKNYFLPNPKTGRVPLLRIMNTNEAKPAELVRRRVRALITELAKNKQNDFAELVSVAPSTLSKMLSGKTLPGDEVLRKIEAATGVRYEWLLKGDEPKLWPDGKIPAVERHDGQRLRDYLEQANIEQKELAERLGKSTTTINQYMDSVRLSTRNRAAILRALNTTYEQIFGDVSSNALISVLPLHTTPYDAEVMVEIPFIPLRARASFDYEIFRDSMNTSPTYPVIINALKANYQKKRAVVIEIDGDSMEPTLYAGYKLTAYEIDPGDYNDTVGLVAVCYDDQFIVKRIQTNTPLSEYLTLVSDNPVGGTRTVAKSRIRAMWQLDELVGGKPR